MLAKFTSKHASDGLVTFVTHKGFAVLFFLPSCCVNSLLTSDAENDDNDKNGDDDDMACDKSPKDHDDGEAMKLMIMINGMIIMMTTTMM